MNNKPNYIEKIEKEIKTETSNRSRLKKIVYALDKLNAYDLDDFLKDILYENEENLSHLYDGTKIFSIMEESIHSFLLLSNHTLSMAQNAIRNFYSEALRTRNTEVIKKIDFITVEAKIGLEAEYIIRKINEYENDKPLYLNLLRLLSHVHRNTKGQENSIDDYWNYKLESITSDSVLVYPVMFHYFQNKNLDKSIKALEIFIENKSKNAEKILEENAEFEMVLISVFRKIYKRKEFKERINNLKGKYTLVDKVLNKLPAINSNESILFKIENRNKNKIKGYEKIFSTN